MGLAPMEKRGAISCRRSASVAHQRFMAVPVEGEHDHVRSSCVCFRRLGFGNRAPDASKLCDVREALVAAVAMARFTRRHEVFVGADPPPNTEHTTHNNGTTLNARLQIEQSSAYCREVLGPLRW